MSTELIMEQVDNDDDDESNVLSLEFRSDDGAETSTTTTATTTPTLWSPSGNRWRDMWHFVGPGWFVSIAYVDPGNYQADIQAGATTRYYLLFCVWWTSILSIYVQVLCVRLAYYGGVTLAQVQAYNTPNNKMRYLNWAIAELSTIITDLPEVIGIGIACNIFFGWPYVVGVVLSLITTMVFLATMNYGIRVLEVLIAAFVGIMSIALWVELSVVGVDWSDAMSGWIYGFVQVTTDDIFAITGILGAVVMPHNLYLHTGSVQSRPAAPIHVKKAVWYASWEPVVPIVVSFFVNMAIVAIAAERVFGTDGASSVGLTDFCSYFKTLKGGCILWAVALLAAGQSSAITTTFTGQFVMDGFLNLKLPVRWRAIITRLVAIAPCVVVSAAFPNDLNRMVNIVNASLSFLLPFALTPLVKYNCSREVMGFHASRGLEKCVLYFFAFGVWFVNALALSINGGGFFGDARARTSSTVSKMGLAVIEITIQVFYLWWNWNCMQSPVRQRVPDHADSEDDLCLQEENSIT